MRILWSLTKLATLTLEQSVKFFENIAVLPKTNNVLEVQPATSITDDQVNKENDKTLTNQRTDVTDPVTFNRVFTFSEQYLPEKKK
ncbi:hypothetical protein TSAR_001290 [Trichomalopsis sarcophagae]|uniref:Uncharacterized protein n=1 Tax=Trichomalopsis sarcophagae TaxID=543379 RepID=A0A232FAX5_9HYME|nr:hypothetical protein TSAR_001290 [Trichomalopsis sarcophagae]